MSSESSRAAQVEIEPPDIQQRNKRYVQIDAVGVGTANAASQFLPVFLTRLGATPVQVGMLTSMPGITGFFLALWVGRFLQRQKNVVPWFSLSRLLVISAFALTGLVPFFVPEDILIPVILIIWALAHCRRPWWQWVSVVMNAVAGPEGRYDLMSRRWSILGITTAITVAIAGQFLDRVDFHLNYQLLFLGLSLGGLVSYYFSSRIQILDIEPSTVASNGSLISGAREYYHLVSQHPAFVSFTLKRFVYLFGITLATPLFPLYFVRELEATDAWIGLLYTAQTVLLVVGYFYWTRQSRHRGSRFVLLVNTFFVALYPGLVALTSNQTVRFVLATAVGVFQAGIDLVFFDELMKTIPIRYSPTFVSLAQSITYLSFILAPLLGTYLSELIGLSGALIFSSGIRLLGFLLFYRQGRQYEHTQTGMPLENHSEV
jgi:predicted MFS family arabinose efflux permease